ncbi:hypothetical protein ACFLZV_02715 [Candidatus Margulisiibacteriota bacterium]
MRLLKAYLLLIIVIIFCHDINGESSIEKAGLLSSEIYKAGQVNLLVSNYPESIEAPGLILDKRIASKKIRLVYYHKNNYKNNLYINAALKNNEKYPVKLKTIKAFAGPTQDGIFAGHKAVKQFFQNILNKNMDEIIIPAGITKQIKYHLVKSGQISVGIIEIEKHAQAAVSLKLMVVDPGYENLSGLNEFLPHNKQICAKFNKLTENRAAISYDCCAVLKEIKIGNKPYLKDKRENIVLHGNYGLFYNIPIILNNEHNEYTNVDLYFSPTAGMARAVLLIDDQLVETGLPREYNNYNPEKIYNFIVKPKEKKTIFIKTMPEPGSFYPVSFVLKSNTHQYTN